MFVADGSGLEYIEEEVVAMLKGVDLDGNDSIEWKVGAVCMSLLNRASKHLF